MTEPQPPQNEELPLPDDPDIAHDQPVGPDMDESTIQDFNDRYGKKP